ncbi:hypothetical protein GM708_18110 [Vibrio cholerae]|nr:hypothetical protein [Vibrio cholerae]
MTASPAPAAPYAYLAGEWTVLVRSGLIAALPADTADATISAVWAAMDDDAGIATLLPLVTGGFGAGLAAMPSFAVASTAAGLQVILRGPVRLTAAGPTGSTTYSGERVTTWTEHLLDTGSVSSFTLECGTPAGTAVPLPLVEGAVLASSITSTPAGTAPDGTAVPGSRDRSDGTAEPRSPGAAARAAEPPAASTVEPAAEPGSLGALDPELEAEPSSSLGELPVPAAAPPTDRPSEGDDSATINPGLYLTSVPPDVADPGVASAVEPLAPIAGVRYPNRQGQDRTVPRPGDRTTPRTTRVPAAPRTTASPVLQTVPSPGPMLAPRRTRAPRDSATTTCGTRPWPAGSRMPPSGKPTTPRPSAPPPTSARRTPDRPSVLGAGPPIPRTNLQGPRGDRQDRTVAPPSALRRLHRHPRRRRCPRPS